jgi:hypothetical protein
VSENFFQSKSGKASDLDMEKTKTEKREKGKEEEKLHVLWGLW